MNRIITINLMNERGPTVSIDGQLAACELDITYADKCAALTVERLVLKVKKPGGGRDDD
jgi:hypothetical protein